MDGVRGPWSVVRSFESRAPVSTEDGPSGETVLVVWPNPTSAATRVSLRLAADVQAARVGVYDALGRKVAFVHDGTAQDVTVFEVDASGWPAGVYAVRATVAPSGGGVASFVRWFTVVR